jgi:hypothetical protein
MNIHTLLLAASNTELFATCFMLVVRVGKDCTVVPLVKQLTATHSQGQMQLMHAATPW